MNNTLKDLTLKFPDQAQADDLLADFLSTASIDTVGVIYKTTGVMLESEEGEQYPELQAIEGWHVNLRCNEQLDTSALVPYIVEVKTPVRVWA